jgi:hypothetical protein
VDRDYVKRYPGAKDYGIDAVDVAVFVVEANLALLSLEQMNLQTMMLMNPEYCLPHRRLCQSMIECCLIQAFHLLHLWPR